MHQVLQISLGHNGSYEIVDKMSAFEWATPWLSANHFQCNFLHFPDGHLPGDQLLFWESKFLVEATIALDVEFFYSFGHCLVIRNNVVHSIFSLGIFDSLLEQIQSLGVEMDWTKG